MEDRRIIELFWQRQEEAIAAVKEKYSAYCAAVAGNILSSPEDTEECLSDTWLRAWDSIPPQRPRDLRAFLARITRNLAFSHWRQSHAEKRGGGELPLVLEELAEVAVGGGPAESLEARELGEAINRWLGEISPERRRVFLGRYWEFLSLEELAAREGMALSRVKSILYRVRKSLKDHLQKEGLLDE